ESGRALTVSGGAFNMDGGALEGEGGVTLSRVTGVVTGTPRVDRTCAVKASELDGAGTLAIASGHVLRLTSSVICADLDNEGVVIIRGVSALNGRVTNAAGATLTIAEGDGDSRLTVAQGFTNDGTIELTDSGGF